MNSMLKLLKKKKQKMIDFRKKHFIMNRRERLDDDGLANGSSTLV